KRKLYIPELRCNARSANFKASEYKRKMTSLKPPSLGTIFAWLRDREPEMIAALREIVRHQSPTRDKEACDALCHHLAREFVAIGGFPHVHKQTTAGDHLEVDFSARASDRKPVLLLGHYDTVHARGAL